MDDKKQILSLIKNSVVGIFPNAKIVLFGSYARGDNHADSDIDLLILLDKDKITYEDATKIMFPLYMLEVANNIPISPKIYSRHFWENEHKITPFYEEVNLDGIVL